MQPFEGAAWVCPACGWRPASRDGYPAFAPDLAAANDGFPPESFTWLAEREAGHFWFRSRNALLLWVLARYFPHAHRMLEIGCGSGFALAAVRRARPDMSLCGSDIFTRAMPVAAGRVPDAQLMQMDARHIPFVKEFDVIGAFDVLEHITEDADVLREMFQAVRPGGGVILTVPQHPALWSPVDEHACHKRRYTRAEMLGKVRTAGFEILRVTSFVSLLLPLILISRVRMRRAGPALNSSAEFDLPRGLNRALEGVLSVERAWIRAGLSFPAGSSLLVVARRPGGQGGDA